MLKDQAIPAELKAFPQWVGWSSTLNPDPSKKPIKKPINPNNGYPAQTNNPSTWGTYEQALDYYQGNKDKISGIGFVFTQDDPYTGIDLDNCVDSSRDIAPFAQDIINRFDSYTELSQSGTGVHIIIKGKKQPDSGCKNGDIECYNSVRFFIFTGNVIDGMETIHDRQSDLDGFLIDVFKKENTKEPSRDSLFAPNESAGEITSNVDVDMVMRRALASITGEKIKDLLDGDNSGYPSESEADLALCNRLAFFCGNIPVSDAGVLMDKIYRKSQRYRPKWDVPHFASGETYGQWTISKALSGTPKRYTSNQGLQPKKASDVAKEMKKAGITYDDIINAAHSGQEGCSNLFTSINRGKLCYDRAAAVWFVWAGHFWELDKHGEPIRTCDKIQDFFRWAEAEIDAKIVTVETQIWQTDDDDENAKKKFKTRKKALLGHRKAISRVINNLNTLVYRKQIVEFSAQGVDSLGITGEEWDKHPWKLAAGNGIIDLITGQLIPGKPEDYMKSACSTSYDPKAECPFFVKFVHDILNNDIELVDFLKIIMGAALIGQGAFKQFLVIFSGQGRNGKDTLMGILQHVLGLNLMAPIPAEMILDSGPNGRRSSQGPSADLMKLRGLRLAYCNETNQGRSFNSGVAKQLSGGGIMTARPPYGTRNVDWEQTHMLVMMTNNRPQAPVDDYAFWKRIKPIHFPLSFVSEPTAANERKADPHIAEELKKESVGILTWLVDGCLHYKQQGLIEPAAVKKALLEYLKDVDIMGIFIDECCIISSSEQVTAELFYKAYKNWSMENGYKVVSNQAFGRYMTARYEKDRTQEGNFYMGICLPAD